MATITGRIGPPVDFPMPGGTAVDGTLDVALCGYGSQVPRVPGYALMGRLTEQNITVDADGNFTFTVSGNDEIIPQGTYYTVTVRNGNGDIAQVNAYQFIGDATYDLSIAAPYDPNQPPPPLPPLITNQLQIVNFSATPDFDGADYTAFRLVLSGDVTSSTITGNLSGNLYTFITIQDATGGHKFVYPPQVYNGALIDTEPGAITVQTFVMSQSNLFAIGPATYYNL